MEWSSLKGRGPRWFTVRKTTCFTKTWHFDSFSAFFIYLFLIGNLLNSSSTQFLVVVFCLAFYTAPFSSKNFFLGLFVRSLSTQLFILEVVLLLLLSVTALTYVGLLSLFWVRPFHTLYLIHLPPRSFLEGLSSEQFAELGPVHFLAVSARACSLAFLPSASPFWTICRAVFIYLVLFGGLCLGLSVFADSVDFSYSEGLFFLFFSGIFHASSTVVFFLPVLFFLAGLHCLLRMLAINSCVGDTWQRLLRDDFTHNGKQVVNRLKIPQGLSTLLFRRWSEVPSRGGVRGDSP